MPQVRFAVCQLKYYCSFSCVFVYFHIGCRNNGRLVSAPPSCTALLFTSVCNSLFLITSFSFCRRGLDGSRHDFPIVLSVDYVHGVIGLSQPGSCSAHYLQGMCSLLVVAVFACFYPCLCDIHSYACRLIVVFTHWALYFFLMYTSTFFLCTFLILQVKALLLYMLKCVVDGNRTLQVKTKLL